MPPPEYTNLNQLDNMISSLPGHIWTNPDVLKYLNNHLAKETPPPPMLPAGVLHSLRPVSNLKDPDILFFEDPSRTGKLSDFEIAHIINNIGPHFGPEELTWPSPLAKVLYLYHSHSPGIYQNMPDYIHSCPQIDKKLMGAVPYTNFLDSSRAGVAMLMPKAYQYAYQALNKFLTPDLRTIDSTKLDAKYKRFISDFGLIGCVPLTDRPTLFRYATKHELEIATIGGSSIAESFYSVCLGFQNVQLRDEVTELAGTGWLNGDKRRGTSRIDSKFIQYMQERYPNLLALLQNPTTSTALKEHFTQRYPDNPYPFTSLIADIMMQMVRQQTVLPKNLRKRERAWRQNAYGDPALTRHVSAKDISEVVISHRFGNTDRTLPPMPWKSFILFPHASYDQEGNLIASFANPDQLIKAAQLIRRYSPQAVIFIPTQDGDPVPYNPIQEMRNRDSRRLSPTIATIATIAHLTLGPDTNHA